MEGHLCHGKPARPGREQRYHGLAMLGGVRDGGLCRGNCGGTGTQLQWPGTSQD